MRGEISCRFWKFPLFSCPFFRNLSGFHIPSSTQNEIWKQNETTQKKPPPTQNLWKNSHPQNKKQHVLQKCLQVAMFSIFLALAAKRKELNVSEQCSCDGLGVEIHQGAKVDPRVGRDPNLWWSIFLSLQKAKKIRFQ